MPTGNPTDIPFPLSSFPGAHPQESAGRVINAYSEPLGDPSMPTGPAKAVWRRAPGLTFFAATAQSGYRGGLIVNNLSYEIWANEAATVTSAGAVSLLGALTGTKKVSIARNLDGAGADVVVVDVDNGAFVVQAAGVPSAPPTAYNGGGALPQPNSVCFQDGFFFFTIGDNRVFASGINALTQNANTFTTVTAKSTASLLRGIAYSGMLFLFTTASCEVWQDTAQPAPGFPYSRLVVLEFGLIQQAAIAGFEEGFSQLLWVSQDFGVYYMPPGNLSPQKVSPPDLDRLIEARVAAGDLLEASVYTFAGKKFWAISSRVWTWEFNLGTQKWNERTSLDGLGAQVRWRASSAHPAFGKWLCGDVLSGNLGFVDDTNFTEFGAPQLFRLESGPVVDFPNRLRIARADFDFDTGVGMNVRSLVTTVTGAASSGGMNLIRLAVMTTQGMLTGEAAIVANVLGTTEANGTWVITVIDATHIDLQGSIFVNAYASGGTVTDVTAPPNVQDPTVAISWSDNNGLIFKNPIVRKLGKQGLTKQTRISVKNTGTSGPFGRRWRLDVSDAVYTAFVGATQASDPRSY